MKRIVDPDARVRLLLNERACAACGGPASNAHHVLPKGRGGDDLYANLIPLCGSGTTGCHGAWHGSPYVIQLARGTARIAPEGMAVADVPATLQERRDRDWVSERAGLYIRQRRPDVVRYLCEKLGDDFGLEFLRRNYAPYLAVGG